MKPMGPQQNKYKGESLSQPFKSLVKPSSMLKLKVLPSARNVVMNPALAFNKRVPQPAMIASGAQFTVQQQGKLEVKSNHMDDEVKSSPKPA